MTCRQRWGKQVSVCVCACAQLCFCAPAHNVLLEWGAKRVWKLNQHNKWNDEQINAWMK